MKVLNNRIAMTSAAAVVALAIPLSVFAGYTPANRATYTCQTPTQCVGANHVVFNSFTNAPNYGDERAFFDGKDAAITTAGGFQDSIKVKDGEIVTLRIYVHNNANPAITPPLGAIARNVRAQVALPNVSKTQMSAIAAIVADNANPLRVDDTVTLSGDRAFTINYLPGSAKFEHRPDGKTAVVAPVADSIVTTGAALGDIKGCFEYAGFVTLKVKVTMPTTVVPTTTPATPPAVTPVTPAAATVTPVAAPAALPETGAELGLAGLAGTGAIGYATMAYRRSRKALAETLLNRS